MRTMTTLRVVGATALFALLIVTPALAQQSVTSPETHHPEPAAGTSATPAPTPMRGPNPAATPTMEICHQMMGDMAAMPKMGGGGIADPKDRAEMLQMRGEMMKAMGDVMMKHARSMRGTQGE